MSDFPFASKTVLAHLLRGALGAGALTAAVLFYEVHLLISAGFVVAALIALRGCPMCWLAGLAMTLSARRSKGISQ